MSSISSLHARRIWDSRGNPTIEVDITTENGGFGRAVAPAGASRGSREAIDLRDGGTFLRGKNVSKAISSLNNIVAPKICGMDVFAQNEVDAALIALDPSPLKEVIGGNSMVAVSLAVLHAAAHVADKPLYQYIAQHYNRIPILPLPEIQIFGGGAHAGRRTDIQDFMVMVPGASSFDEMMEITSEVYFAAGDILAQRGQLAGIADEGGWWPNFDSNEHALETLVMAIEKAGEKPGDKVVISLDVAASEFGKAGQYHLALEDRKMNTEQMIAMLGKWCLDYPIVSIEDPLSEDDTDGMIAFTKIFGDKLQIIGDDYLVTNAKLVEQAIAEKACNAVLLKVNQIGTVSEAMRTFFEAEEAGWQVVVSARSGETEDVSISHIATGLGAGQLKVGSFQRSERMAKWNECLRMQDTLGAAQYAAGSSLKNTWWQQN
ncbi:MAG: phosphopyruvate hydratase [Alphaproteobacteria bacterium]|nr:phosphopyruvate hydratase [Alphaproteobacteria bacterium]